ncbi:MAG: hypothetical protein U5L01_01730 [Rheinheimera sp.]|nr:hypothetical protein [Rheinheimera sp.]
MAYDLEGLVVITARDPETGRQIRQLMDAQTEAMDNALLAQQPWVEAMRINP